MKYNITLISVILQSITQLITTPLIPVPTDEDPCECDSLVKFQKKVEDALQVLTKKYILYNK